MDERDVLRNWRELFRETEISTDTLAQAEMLLEGLSGESPLLVRLANELEELKQGPTVAKKGRARPRQSTK